MFQNIFKNMFKRRYSEVALGVGICQLNRDTFEVKIHDRTAVIEAEYIGGEYTRDIYPESVVNWNPPHDIEIFSETDRYDVVRALQLFFDQTKETYYPLDQNHKGTDPNGSFQ